MLYLSGNCLSEMSKIYPSRLFVESTGKTNGQSAKRQSKEIVKSDDYIPNDIQSILIINDQPTETSTKILLARLVFP